MEEITKKDIVEKENLASKKYKHISEIHHKWPV